VIHNDDADYNTLIADTIMGNNTTAREGGDAIFYVDKPAASSRPAPASSTTSTARTDRR